MTRPVVREYRAKFGTVAGYRVPQDPCPICGRRIALHEHCACCHILIGKGHIADALVLGEYPLRSTGGQIKGTAIGMICSGCAKVSGLERTLEEALPEAMWPPQAGVLMPARSR